MIDAKQLISNFLASIKPRLSWQRQHIGVFYCLHSLGNQKFLRVSFRFKYLFLKESKNFSEFRLFAELIQSKYF